MWWQEAFHLLVKLRHYIIVLSHCGFVSLKLKQLILWWWCMAWRGILETVCLLGTAEGQRSSYQSKSQSQGIGNIYPDFLYTTGVCLSFATTRNEEIVPVGKCHLCHWFCELCFLGTGTLNLPVLIVWQKWVVATGSMGVKISTVLLFVEFAGSTKCESDLESRAYYRSETFRKESPEKDWRPHSYRGAVWQYWGNSPVAWSLQVLGNAYSICSVNPENLLCFLGRKNKLFWRQFNHV